MRFTNPECPRCHCPRMKRFFTRGDRVVLVTLTVIFFPVGVWIYLKPRHFYCPRCGFALFEKPEPKRRQKRDHD